MQFRTGMIGSAVAALLVATPLTAFAQDAGVGTGTSGGVGASTPLLPGATGSSGITGSPASTVPNSGTDPISNSVQDSVNASETSSNANDAATSLRTGITGTQPGTATTAVPGGSALGGSVGAGTTAGGAAGAGAGAGAGVGAGAAVEGVTVDQSVAIQSFGEIKNFTDLLASVATDGTANGLSFSEVDDVQVKPAKSFENFYPEAVDGLVSNNKQGLDALHKALKDSKKVSTAVEKAGADADDVIAVGGTKDNGIVLYTY